MTIWSCRALCKTVAALRNYSQLKAKFKEVNKWPSRCEPARHLNAILYWFLKFFYFLIFSLLEFVMLLWVLSNVYFKCLDSECGRYNMPIICTELWTYNEIHSKIKMACCEFFWFFERLWRERTAIVMSCSYNTKNCKNKKLKLNCLEFWKHFRNLI